MSKNVSLYRMFHWPVGEHAWFAYDETPMKLGGFAMDTNAVLSVKNSRSAPVLSFAGRWARVAHDEIPNREVV